MLKDRLVQPQPLEPDAHSVAASCSASWFSEASGELPQQANASIGWPQQEQDEAMFTDHGISSRLLAAILAIGLLFVSSLPCRPITNNLIAGACFPV